MCGISAISALASPKVLAAAHGRDAPSQRDLRSHPGALPLEGNAPFGALGSRGRVQIRGQPCLRGRDRPGQLLQLAQEVDPLCVVRLGR